MILVGGFGLGGGVAVVGEGGDGRDARGEVRMGWRRQGGAMGY